MGKVKAKKSETSVKTTSAHEPRAAPTRRSSVHHTPYKATGVPAFAYHVQTYTIQLIVINLANLLLFIICFGFDKLTGKRKKSTLQYENIYYTIFFYLKVRQHTCNSSGVT